MIDNSGFKKKFEKLNKKILNIKDIEVGILGGINEKYWIDCGKKQYLFKYNQSEKDFSDFGEVFTSYISYILGVKCVKSTFAEDFFATSENKNNGVLIESYRTKNVKESFSLSSLIEKYKRRHFSGYTVKETLSIVKDFSFDNNLILDKKIEQELKEMALMDYLLLQTDRHAKNIEFLIVEEENCRKIKLAPMFDNGFCLYLQNTQKINIECLKKLLQNKFLNISLNKSNLKPSFYIEKSEKINDTGEAVVKDLANELLQNKKLMNIFEKFCKIDIYEEVEFVSSMKKIPLPNLNKNLIRFGIQNRIKLLEIEILKQRMLLNRLDKKVSINDCFTL